MGPPFLSKHPLNIFVCLLALSLQKKIAQIAHRVRPTRLSHAVKRACYYTYPLKWDVCVCVCTHARARVRAYVFTPSPRLVPPLPPHLDV